MNDPRIHEAARNAIAGSEVTLKERLLTDAVFRQGFETANKLAVAYLRDSAQVSKELWLENEHTAIGEYYRGGMNSEHFAARDLEKGKHVDD